MDSTATKRRPTRKADGASAKPAGVGRKKRGRAKAAAETGAGRFVRRSKARALSSFVHVAKRASATEIVETLKVSRKDQKAAHTAVDSVVGTSSARRG